jgi:hypothetical protein
MILLRCFWGKISHRCFKGLSVKRIVHDMELNT